MQITIDIPAPKFKAGDWVRGAKGHRAGREGQIGIVIRVSDCGPYPVWVRWFGATQDFASSADPLIPYVPLPGEKVVVVFENYPTLNMHYYATDGIVTTFDDGQVVFGNTLIKSIEPDLEAK